MHRFYSQYSDFKQTDLVITDRDEIHHMKDVLRLKSGDIIEVFNGQGQEAQARLVTLGDSRIVARIAKVAMPNSESKVSVTLVCAVPKKGKFETIIEKATELGIDEIIPLKTKRTEVVFSPEKASAKSSRFQKVAMNAAKQSGRTKVPMIRPMTPVAEILKNLPPGALCLFPSLQGQSRPILDALKAAKEVSRVLIFIGPEGDFTPEEAALAAQNGCVPVSLGITVLKVDTAAISTVALVRFWFCA